MSIKKQPHTATDHPLSSQVGGRSAEKGDPAVGDLSRRRFLQWSALASAAGFLHFPLAMAASVAGRIRPLPLANVRLMPSIFLESLQANRRYLLELDPYRLLHNFYQFAGLETKGEVYGGWESDTLAGHTLGHYLSALSLTYAQTGDEPMLERVHIIVAELARVQAKDGYVAGFYRKDSQGKQESGRKVFEEVQQGTINAAAFNLNGCWAPLYTWHKLLAGLLDAQSHCGNAQALAVAVKLAGYLDWVFSALDDKQMQQVLNTEFGGIGESLLELSERTSNPRWLALGKRFRHARIVDPLIVQQDILTGHHANTQIPKLIAEARQFELTGDVDSAAAARFFWETVVNHHTYVIGGNADREYFQRPDSTVDFLTEQTCEHCNSYNMLKLTRHLYQWTPETRYIDYYERTLYNHTLAAQNPTTGMFAYMMPMIAGGTRFYSDKFHSFWCCVGSGMEAHAQFSDTIFWEDGSTLYVNLYIPCHLDWKARSFALDLDSGVPTNGKVRLTVRKSSAQAPAQIALRIPAWSEGRFELHINGQISHNKAVDGYVTIKRVWMTGDVITLDLAIPLRLESAAGAKEVVSVLRGPVVMAADVGSMNEQYNAPAPTLVADHSPLEGFVELPESGHYLVKTSRPVGLRFVPFYAQYERRSALYFQRMTPQNWANEEKRRGLIAAENAALVSKSIDLIEFGNSASEQAHHLTSEMSFVGYYRRSPCRDVRSGGFLEFSMKNRNSPLVLRLRYWGSDRGRFNILINGKLAVKVEVDRSSVIDFVDRDYPLPNELLVGQTLQIRFEPQRGDTAGPFFGCWLMPV
ncbi:hypothetical protein PEC302107_17960 [Pectobacterium araliae]|uniref:Glycoside hydrolase family 127 protein n=1 Tax=Pectobacterium araliae TaxID=3073862 RepID=A0AAN0KDM0_9GAMM|nr:glycoside hydrolase family 127 protein [Pectobacterium sp. MAFF 302110]GKW20067.1 hypothetical protein PEC302107_17960 [Pectobacterium carotovorum subsp. carotovorum]